MKPLEGIRVLEFARVLAGPFAGQILAELGADVIKVERPGTGDESRHFEPRWEDGSSAYFDGFNRGKRSVALNLKSEGGVRVARHLARKADILIENFLPGTMSGYGLDAATLRADNPGLIYISATGFGQTGPDANRPGYDTVFQALSGITAMTGPPEGPPCKAGLPVADLTTALWIVISALTGLAGRRVGGHGTHVDLAIMDVQLSLLSIPAARYLALGETPARMGSAHHGRVPSAAYRCANDQWLQISASDQHWAAVCSVLGLDDLADDEALKTNANRVARRDEVERALSRALATRDRTEVKAAFDAARVPAGEILTLPEALNRPQARHRGAVVDVPREGRQTVRGLRIPGRFDSFDDPEALSTPELGADTDAILNELGFDQAAIAALRDEGAV